MAFGSDWFVSPPAPLVQIWAAVNRLDHQNNVFIPEERVSVEDAIYCSTLGASYSVHEENNKGSIQVGKLADIVIIDKSLFKVNKEDID
jgi:predicted amidohydrolase YtcJ